MARGESHEEIENESPLYSPSVKDLESSQYRGIREPWTEYPLFESDSVWGQVLITATWHRQRKRFPGWGVPLQLRLEVPTMAVLTKNFAGTRGLELPRGIWKETRRLLEQSWGQRKTSSGGLGIAPSIAHLLDQFWCVDNCRPPSHRGLSLEFLNSA